MEPPGPAQTRLESLASAHAADRICVSTALEAWVLASQVCSAPPERQSTNSPATRTLLLSTPCATVHCCWPLASDCASSVPCWPSTQTSSPLAMCGAKAALSRLIWRACPPAPAAPCDQMLLCWPLASRQLSAQIMDEPSDEGSVSAWPGARD